MTARTAGVPGPSAATAEALGEGSGGTAYLVGEAPHLARLVSAAVGERHRDAGDRVPDVVEHRGRNAGEPGGDLSLLRRVPAAPRLREHRAQGAEGARTGSVAVDEGGRVRVQRSDLGCGQCGQDRP